MSGPTSIEQICNQVLDRIGYPSYIGNIYDGTKQARAFLNNWGPVRDELLRQKNWPFAFREVAATTAGISILGWAYSWQYPTDCLRMRAVSPTVIPSPNLDPQQVLWELFNTGAGGVKVVLTQITPVALHYIGQVTDITLWEPAFVEAMVQSLGAKVGFQLKKTVPPLADPDKAIGVAVGSDDPLAPDDDDQQMPQQRRAQQ